MPQKLNQRMVKHWVVIHIPTTSQDDSFPSTNSRLRSDKLKWPAAGKIQYISHETYIHYVSLYMNIRFILYNIYIYIYIYAYIYIYIYIYINI